MRNSKWLAVLVAAATLGLAACTSSTPTARVASSGATGTASSPSSPAAPGSAVAAVQADLRSALSATSWPQLNPPFSHGPDHDTRGCAVDAVPPLSQCIWGNPNATHTLYLVGDSTSAAYVPAFAAIMAQLPTWRMVVRSDSGCPFSAMPAPEGPGIDPNAKSVACSEHDAKVVAEINSEHPDLVVFTTVAGGSGGIPGKQTELTRIESAVGRIVVLPTSPPLMDPLKCDTPGSTPSACVSPIPADYPVWMSNLRAVAAAVHGTFIDPTQLFCADGKCPVFVNTIPKTKDGVHMTVSYSHYLAPAILELFTENHLLP